MNETQGTEGRGWKNRPIREPDRHRVRWLWRMLLGIVAAFAPAGAYLMHQNACLEASYELNALSSENERLAEEEQRLKVERARLESLTRIDAWAARQDRLVDPGVEQVLVVREAASETKELIAQRPGPRNP